MRRRSPSYGSPPRRGYGERGRSPPRGRFSGRRDADTSLLVRNIPRECRSEDVRIPFERFGRVKDVYLPKDYYSGEPRGFGFVQYFDPVDAAEAKHHMDHQMFNGREITVVFAEENRKKPDEMRIKGRPRGRTGYGGRRRSPYDGPSRSHSPHYRSPSPRGRKHSRDHISRSPDMHRRGQGRSLSADKFCSPYSKDGRGNSTSKGHGKSRLPSTSPLTRRNAKSPLQKRSRSRSSSLQDSRSPPRSPSLPPRRRRSSPAKQSLPRESPGPLQKKEYSNVTPEERSP